MSCVAHNLQLQSIHRSALCQARHIEFCGDESAMWFNYKHRLLLPLVQLQYNMATLCHSSTLPDILSTWSKRLCDRSWDNEWLIKSTTSCVSPLLLNDQINNRQDKRLGCSTIVALRSLSDQTVVNPKDHPRNSQKRACPKTVVNNQSSTFNLALSGLDCPSGWLGMCCKAGLVVF